MNIALRTAPANLSSAEYDARQSTAAVARVEVFDTFEAAEPFWRMLEGADALMTPYQRFQWASLWHRQVSGRHGATPLIIVAFDGRHAPLFVLPLERQRHLGITVASFIGGKHANLNAAIWRRDAVGKIDAEDLREVLRDVATQHGIDVFRLIVQPSQLSACPNPLALLAHQSGPDDVYVARFDGLDATAALNACTSGSMRKRLRSKERRLADLPHYRVFEARSAADVERILAAFLAQKAAHLAGQGIFNAFDDPAIIEFLRSASTEGLERGAPVIELRAIEAEGEVIAVFGGITDGRRMSCMFISYTTGPARQWSPGLILLAKMIAHYAERGVGSLDLGAGRALYKTYFCKDTERVFDTIIGMSPRGRLAAFGIRKFRRLKGALKSHPALWSLVTSFRRLLRKA
jgi:CelD/BcsL family acetyltransferase involved in cellulose biosynthesis